MWTCHGPWKILKSRQCNVGPPTFLSPPPLYLWKFLPGVENLSTLNECHKDCFTWSVNIQLGRTLKGPWDSRIQKSCNFHLNSFYFDGSNSNYNLLVSRPLKVSHHCSLRSFQNFQWFGFFFCFCNIPFPTSEEESCFNPLEGYRISTSNAVTHWRGSSISASYYFGCRRGEARGKRENISRNVRNRLSKWLSSNILCIHPLNFP